MSHRYPGGANHPDRGAIGLGPAERLLLVVVVVVLAALGSLWLATALAAAWMDIGLFSGAFGPWRSGRARSGTRPRGSEWLASWGPARSWSGTSG